MDHSERIMIMSIYPIYSTLELAFREEHPSLSYTLLLLNRAKRVIDVSCEGSAAAISHFSTKHAFDGFTKTPTECFCFLRICFVLDVCAALFVMRAAATSVIPLLCRWYKANSCISADTSCTYAECAPCVCDAIIILCPVLADLMPRPNALGVLHILFIYTRTVSPTKGWKSFQTSAVNGQIILPQIFRRWLKEAERAAGFVTIEGVCYICI